MGDLSQMPPQEETTVSFGRLNPSIYIVPLRRRYPDRHDSADGNWVDARVTINTGMFHGDFAACLRSDEMLAFRNQIEALLDETSQTAVYHSMERWLKIEILNKKYGHFLGKFEARDDAGSTNCLQFAIEMDRSEVVESRSQIEGWLKHLPVR